MNNKIVGVFICMLLIITILPTTVLAGDEKNPEIKDKWGDMFKHADILSVWFHEDGNNPDYLHLSLKTRDLIDKTQIFETIYFINWNLHSNTYAADLHVFPEGKSDFISGKAIFTGHGISGYESYVICNGTFDVDKNIITWIIPKDAIGNPHPGDILTKPFASTDLRFPFNTNYPHFDLFKDLSWNAWYRKDYTIQF